jgi:hypothetical protein
VDLAFGALAVGDVLHRAAHRGILSVALDALEARLRAADFLAAVVAVLERARGAIAQDGVDRALDRGRIVWRQQARTDLRDAAAR